MPPTCYMYENFDVLEQKKIIKIVCLYLYNIHCTFLVTKYFDIFVQFLIG